MFCIRWSLLRAIILFILLIPLQGTALYSHSPPDSKDLLEKQMRKLMRKHHLPAFALSIVEDDNVLFQSVKGYADLENQVLATPGTIFKIYSVSKVFTALEIFREVEEGLIQLEDPITKYLPDFLIQSRFSEEVPITVKSLLAHRSGLPRNECLTCPSHEDDPFTLHKSEWCTSDCFMAYPVGYRYKYSNLGYNLLGRIVEENRNMGFERYMKDHLLNDLHTKSSAFQSSDLDKSQAVAMGYEYYKRKYYPIQQSDVKSVPSGNLYSTLEDLSLFLQAVLKNEIFAQKNTLAQMCIDHYSSELDPETMGLGWKTCHIAGGELMIWHDGGPDDGVGALVAAVPSQDLAIAMIANSTNFGGNISVLFAKEVLEGLINEKLKRDGMPVQKEDRLYLSEQTLQSYEGLYMAFGTPMRIKAKKKKLKAKIGGFTLSLIPVNDTEFKVSHWMDKIGLTKIIPPTVAFDKLRILFPPCSTEKPDFAIINLDEISYEICSRFPEYETLPSEWDHLLGNYQMAWRLPDNQIGPLSGSTYTISWEEGVLMMSGPFGPILPDDKHHIRLTSMPFLGETMEYFPETGYLIHQNAVFIPVKD